MTERDRVLLSLLAYELFRQELQIDVAAVDWESVIDEGTRHAVTALLYPGMRQIAGVPEEELSKARGAAIASAEASEHMLNSQRTVLDLLQEKGIPCAVLKGTSVAMHYPHPELRIPGDIDLLVDRENIQAACLVLEKNGFALAYTNEKHLCFQKRELWIEVHRMVSEFPDIAKGIFTDEYLLSALRHVRTVEIDGISFPVLTGMYQTISLLAHLEGHIRGSGIGLRQLCDWAVAVHAQREEIGETELALLDRCGLLFFAKIATRLCEKYLGLPPFEWSVNVPDATADALMHDILASGNFHSQDMNPFSIVRAWGVLADADKAENGKKSSMLRSYGHYLRFRVRHEYPWAKSGLWIVVFGVFYPFRWIVRMLLGKRKKVSLSQSVRSAQRRETLLRELRLYR